MIKFTKKPDTAEAITLNELIDFINENYTPAPTEVSFRGLKINYDGKYFTIPIDGKETLLFTPNDLLVFYPDGKFEIVDGEKFLKGWEKAESNTGKAITTLLGSLLK